MKRIDITKILEKCPKDMELDSIIHEDPVLFKSITPAGEITCTTKNNVFFYVNRYGELTHYGSCKCVIYPKDTTTWEGFVPPINFKDGDVYYIKTKKDYEYISILKVNGDYNYVFKYASLSCTVLYTDRNPICSTDRIKEIRLATEDEKKKLFQAIRRHGYRWDAQTKTLERALNFKIGDKVRHKSYPQFTYTITGITNNSYECGKSFVFRFTTQDEYELVPDKFDINTLKPFDKVLVRDRDTGIWRASLYSHCNRYSTYHFVTAAGAFIQCIPYEGNEHLLGTTNKCDDYFINS